MVLVLGSVSGHPFPAPPPPAGAGAASPGLVESSPGVAPIAALLPRTIPIAAVLLSPTIRGYRKTVDGRPPAYKSVSGLVSNRDHGKIENQGCQQNSTKQSRVRSYAHMGSLRSDCSRCGKDEG